jgi:Protein of unknown function (DUF3179)
MVCAKWGTMMVTRRKFATGLTLAALMPHVAWAQEDVEFRWQWAVSGGTDREAAAALEAIVQGRRTDLIAGLILSLRFNPDRAAEIGETLKVLTADRKARDWFDWMIWQEAHPEVIPHPSFADYMRDLYLRIDPNFDAFLQPEYLTRDRMGIRVEEITWGGVVKDGIPSLDNPTMIAANAADYMRDDDLVFGVSINGDVRAYPLRIMGWHEMFNDVIGGVPVALAYCTLCGSGILYETKVQGRSKPFVFGSSGFLYRSNKLMFDRQTNSLWNQYTGAPVVGTLASSGIVLEQRPVVIAKWVDWRGSNPGTTILSLDTGHRRNYGSGVVYQDYFASADLMFPALSSQSRQTQKDYVFGIRQFGAAKAWPLQVFVQKPVINDAVGDLAVVVIGDAASRSARAYERGDLTFTSKGAGLVSGGGTVWAVTEEALTTADGRNLPRVAGSVSYLFAWDNYLGDAGQIYGR